MSRPMTIVAMWMKKSRQVWRRVLGRVDVEHGCSGGSGVSAMLRE